MTKVKLTIVNSNSEILEFVWVQSPVGSPNTKSPEQLENELAAKIIDYLGMKFEMQEV